MTARTHDLAAITALGVVFILRPSATITLSTAIVAVLANLIGGITPDIDQPTAPLWRNLPIGKYFGRMFGMLNGGHRFLTHSLVGLYLFGLAAHWFLQLVHPITGSVDLDLVWRAFMLGMLSHLVMDTLTKEGVPWLLPIPIKFGVPPLKRLRITTGKAGETLLVFPALILFNIAFYFAHYHQLLNILHRHIT
ncbi:MAG: Membrane protein containing transrane [Candidatus Saccharibacteria bacterium]|nr:Membrane protein containing transrane [Candidatus Saccharibacteria bacterium]